MSTCLPTTNRAVVTVIAVSAAIALAGCGGDISGPSAPTSTAPWAQQWTPGMQSPTQRAAATPATTLPPEFTDVDRTDPDAVALAVATIWFTWDTTTDSGPDDAAARTAPLLTPSYATALTSGAPQAWPGADWMAWRDQRARLEATVRPGAEPVPPATATTAYALVVVDQAVTLPDGTVTMHIPAVVAVTLAKGAHGWEVASVERR